MGLVAAATFARPAAWRHFAAGSVSAYALSPRGWELIVRGQPEAPRSAEGSR
ncbi:hypothetical protein [Nonomuraea aridisoli]|uniref:hypothetical protein n=1 Tax=Nonomuraea aridisoli TaxID=2070368 RepID=UPI0015E8A883|nr:hypothetical protein [Nonomuraea aridisoli]